MDFNISAISDYFDKLRLAFSLAEVNKIKFLADSMLDAAKNKKNIFFCGNGGSAGNANHLANDFLFGAGKFNKCGIRVESLASNTSVITCLANDIGYDEIFSEQLRVKGNKDDILILLSGSGNSSNIIKAIETADKLKIRTFAILGFDGGKAKKLVQYPIHFNINDMQISEDMQLIVGHICMKYLSVNKF